jgi:hypothetical protein
VWIVRFTRFPNSLTASAQHALKREGILDINPHAPRDYYLVFTGPKPRKGALISTRGSLRPFCIDAVYLFDAHRLHAELQERGVKVGLLPASARCIGSRQRYIRGRTTHCCQSAIGSVVSLSCLPAINSFVLTSARLHDLRHTFAALQLSAGVHFMQVSRWLGHTRRTRGRWTCTATTFPRPTLRPYSPSGKYLSGRGYDT